MNILALVRPAIVAMPGYTPGEQPAPGERLIKLNTNENPYPPPPEVLAALAEAARGPVWLYPDPSSRPVREAAADAFGLSPEQVVVGNGSDDLLNLAIRTFVDPGQVVAAPTPTYTLYEPLTRIQGGEYRPFPWGEGLALPMEALVATEAQLIFLARPNAPTGHVVSLEAVLELCRRAPGVVLLDEAYGDFADDHGLPLLAQAENLVVTRSFSKSLSQAGMRIGLGFMHPELARQMHKVRDSYNLDRLSQAAAVASLRHLAAFRPAVEAIRRERERCREALLARGFAVPPSQANFLLATVPPGGRTAGEWVADLRREGILVRHFASDPGLADKIRVTIGDPGQMALFLEAVDRLLMTGI